MAFAGLRQQDEDEVRAAGHDDGTSALLASVKASDMAFTIWVDGEAAGIFGVAKHPEDPQIGIPWMLGTDRLLRARRALVYESRPWIDFLNERYPLLTNIVHSQNDVSIRWLKAMGFTMDEAVEMGEHEFWSFYRCANR